MRPYSTDSKVRLMGLKSQLVLWTSGKLLNFPGPQFSHV